MLWLLSHPYAGIYHDANIYTLMALRWLDMEAYVRDPLFLFGSQDDFSLFSPLYGCLISLLGVSGASRFLVLLGGTAWLGASWLMARRVLPDPRPAGVALLCCAIFSLNISPDGSTFVLNENFVTARLFAIPLGAAAVALNTGPTALWPVLLSVAATLLHPLFGIWSLLTVVAVRCSNRQLFVALIFGILVFPLLIGSGLFPALRLLSAERLTLLMDSTRDVLVSGNFGRLNSLLFWLGALLIGARYGGERFRRTYLVVVLLASLGYLAAVLAAKYFPVDLVLQVQPWRAMWLAAYLSVFALIDVAWVMAKDRRLGGLAVIGVALMLVLAKDLAGWLLLIGWIVSRSPERVQRHLQRVVVSPTQGKIMLGVLCIAALPGYIADVRLEGEGLVHFGWTAEDTVRGIVGGGGYGLGPLVIAAVLVNQRLRKWAVMLVLLPAAAWAVAGWDTRDKIAQSWENAIQVGFPPPIDGLQRGQSVYWPGALQRVWFDLGTVGYVGIYHMSGLIFSQPRTELLTARWRRAAIASVAQEPIMDEADREAALAAFRLKHPNRNFFAEPAGSYMTNSLSVQGVVFLCSDPDLDWVVAGYPSVAGIQGIPFATPGDHQQRHYAYSCNSWRNQGMALVK